MTNPYDDEAASDPMDDELAGTSLSSGLTDGLGDDAVGNAADVDDRLDPNLDLNETADGEAADPNADLMRADTDPLPDAQVPGAGADR